MRFRHLWIFRNFEAISAFYREMESRTRFSDYSSQHSRAHHRLTIHRADGEHEISVYAVDQVEHEVTRGHTFDKVSIQEGVELNIRIHIALQICVGRSIRSPCGGPGSLKIVTNPHISDGEMFFLSEGSVKFDRATDTDQYELRGYYDHWMTQPMWDRLISVSSV